MKLFIDTANLEEIKAALEGGFVAGITTNPSLLAKEPKSNYLVHMRKIVALAKEYGGTFSLSVEVFSNDPAGMVAQAREFVCDLAYPHLAIKIPVSYGQRDNLAVIRELSRMGIAVNCTACMTPLQAILAAASGARYVSLFYNRLKEGGTEEQFADQRNAALGQRVLEQSDFDPDRVVAETRALLVSHPRAEIISGSIRYPLDVKRAGLAGSHIVTASLKIIRAALQHYKTDDAVDRFLKDFAQWNNPQVNVTEK